MEYVIIVRQVEDLVMSRTQSGRDKHDEVAEQA